MSFEELVLKRLRKSVKSISIENKLKGNGKLYFYLKEDDKIEYIRGIISRKVDGFKQELDIEAFDLFDNIRDDYLFVMGMILNVYEGKLNEDSVYLFNPLNHTSTLIKLNLKYLESYSLYSGIIVALKVKNVDGMELLVEKIFYSYEEKEKIEEQENLSSMNDSLASFGIKPTGIRFSNSKIKKSSDCIIKIVSGPFFVENNLKTLDFILKTPIDVIILLGPFIDDISCCTNSKFYNPLEYYNQITYKLEEYIKKFPSSHIIIIPSTEDLFSFNVYPQPPLKILSDRIHSFSNPALFFINDILFSSTTKDHLLLICSEEIYKPGSDIQKNTIDRISTHYIEQNTPLPVLNTETVSYNNILDFHSTEAPVYSIITSKFKPFIKNIKSTTLLNVGSQPRIENKNYIEIELTEEPKITLKPFIE